MKMLQSKGIPLCAHGGAIAINTQPQQITFVQEVDVLDVLCNLYEYEEKGCQVLFLPAYFPDISMIEETFSLVRSILRCKKA